MANDRFGQRHTASADNPKAILVRLRPDGTPDAELEAVKTPPDHAGRVPGQLRFGRLLLSRGLQQRSCNAQNYTGAR